ncbi:MAG: class I SAM-dependent methyltransferase, partial [Nitrososphaerota archaeon]
MPRRGHSRLDPFVPTGWDIVGKMIDFADVEESSVVVDLGSGDGRLAIESNRSYGARSIGVELNPILVDISNRKTRLLGLEGVSFLNADIRMISLEGVTHVTAYLTSEALKRIEHVLLTAPQEAIIVTHNYPIPGWRPVETLDTWSSSDAR